MPCARIRTLGSERVGRGGCVCVQPKSLGDSDRLSTPFPSCKLLASRAHRRVLCAVARHPERRTCSTRSALHYFILVFADRHPASDPTDARLPHDHHPDQWEEPRMRGRPGCMRACHPVDSVRQLRCLRECPFPPVVSRVVIPSRGCAYPVLSIAPAYSGRLNASTASCEISGPLALRVRIRVV